MAKRQRLTVEQILEDISDDEDYDDPDEPLMEGSDDDFSDLDMDEDDLYDPTDIGSPSGSSTVPNSPTQPHPQCCPWTQHSQLSFPSTISKWHLPKLFT